MSPAARPDGWIRRAQPRLGTIVEIGVCARRPPRRTDDEFAGAFAEIGRVEGLLSRFAPDSDVSRFNRLPAGCVLEVSAAMAAVMQTACSLRAATAALFDVSVGSAPGGWRIEGRRLQKLDDGCRLDLGGIAKGFVVDRIVERLLAAGCEDGWVNAGGDLRAFGRADVPVMLRDESLGGVTPFARLANGAFATSRLARSGTAPERPSWAAPHVSVAAPECVFADALTKVVAATANVDHPLLARHGAVGFIHAATPGTAVA